MRGTKVYWIGGDEKTSNVLRWSHRSGGAPMGRLPKPEEIICIDDKSFGVQDDLHIVVDNVMQVPGVLFNVRTKRSDGERRTITMDGLGHIDVGNLNYRGNKTLTLKPKSKVRGLLIRLLTRLEYIPLKLCLHQWSWFVEKVLQYGLVLRVKHN